MTDPNVTEYRLGDAKQKVIDDIEAMCVAQVAEIEKLGLEGSYTALANRILIAIYGGGNDETEET